MQVTFKNKNRVACEENPLWIKSPNPCPQLTQSASQQTLSCLRSLQFLETYVHHSDKMSTVVLNI